MKYNNSNSHKSAENKNIKYINSSKNCTEWAAFNLVKQSRQFKRNGKYSIKELIVNTGIETLKGTLRGLVIGFAVKGGINVLFETLKGFNHKKMISVLFSNDVFSFVKFLALFTGVFRGLNRALFLVSGKNERANAAVAGFVASWALVLDNQRRRRDLALWLFFKALYVLVQTGVRNQVLPYIPGFQNFSLGVANMYITYAYFHEPDTLNKGYISWVISQTNQKQQDLQLTIRNRNEHFAATGEWLPFVPCQTCLHDGPCLTYFCKDFLWGFIRATKTYLPVYVIPLIIFRLQKLIKNPIGITVKLLKSIVASSLFLSSFLESAKLSVCLGRNIFKRDFKVVATLSGLLAGVGALFETSARTTDNLLYCSLQSAEGIWNFLKKRKLVQGIKYGEVSLFSFAIAVLLSSPKSDIKPSDFNSLKLLIGSK